MQLDATKNDNKNTTTAYRHKAQCVLKFILVQVLVAVYITIPIIEHNVKHDKENRKCDLLKLFSIAYSLGELYIS